MAFADLTRDDQDAFRANTKVAQTAVQQVFRELGYEVGHNVRSDIDGSVLMRFVNVSRSADSPTLGDCVTVRIERTLSMFEEEVE